jgi:hypothetical protein
MVDGKRGVNDPGAVWPVRPQAIVSGGRSRPAVSMSDEAREQPPSSGGFAGNSTHSFSLAGADGPTAITSRSMRARRGAVQGSPLRSDRALRARLARVGVRPGGPSLAVSARP